MVLTLFQLLLLMLRWMLMHQRLEKLPSPWLLTKRGARERPKHLLLLLLTLGIRFHLFQEFPLPPRQQLLVQLQNQLPLALPQLQQLQQPPSLLSLKIGPHRSPWPPSLSPRPNHLPRLQKRTFLVPNLLLPHLMRISCNCSSLRRHFLTSLKLLLFLCTRRA